MKAKSKPKSPPPDTDSTLTDTDSTLKVFCAPNQDPAVMSAKAVLGPNFSSAVTSIQWSQKYCGGRLAVMGTVTALDDAATKVKQGDLCEVEARLLSQATTLDAMFAELSRRAVMNITEYLDAFERYMKLALKAQNQSRMTLETLANVKNPPVVYAKQANISNGPQQVNNNTASRAPATQTESRPSKLIEQPNETPMDARAAGNACAAHSQLEAMDKVNRAKVA